MITPTAIPTELPVESPGLGAAVVVVAGVVVAAVVGAAVVGAAVVGPAVVGAAVVGAADCVFWSSLKKMSFSFHNLTQIKLLFPYSSISINT